MYDSTSTLATYYPRRSLHLNQSSIKYLNGDLGHISIHV
jgi:hypothetical protein